MNTTNSDSEWIRYKGNCILFAGKKGELIMSEDASEEVDVDEENP
jgi:hypothetical protein